MNDIMSDIAKHNPRKFAKDLVKGDIFRYQFTADGRREAVEVLQDAPVECSYDPALPVIVLTEIIRTGDRAHIRLLSLTSVDVC